MKDELAKDCDERIRAGSLSFSFASRLFGNEMRRSAHLLYAWCRRVDDMIDSAASSDEAARALEKARAETQAAFTGAPMHDPAFAALQLLARDRGLPRLYADELLLGMQMDVEHAHYRNLAELELYCYRVAGVVGLMMTHAMKISSDDALEPAVRVGLAMQMTNIARDIRDDWRVGRCYIPLEWTTEVAEFSGETFVEPTRRLLACAREHYRAGRKGLRFLPLRAAIAVAVAMEIYEDIGRLVLQRGAGAWDTRAMTSTPRKVWLALRGLARALATLPMRLRQHRVMRVPSRLFVFVPYSFEG